MTIDDAIKGGIYVDFDSDVFNDEDRQNAMAIGELMIKEGEPDFDFITRMATILSAILDVRTFGIVKLVATSACTYAITHKPNLH